MIDKLTQLIADDYHCQAKGGHYQLKEDKQVGMPITTIKASAKLLLCKFDEDTIKLLPFFKEGMPGAHTMADYIAFVPNSGKIFTYVIELSLTIAKTRQRKPTEDFIKYIEVVARRLFPQLPEFVYRYILIKQTSPSKGHTKQNQVFDKNGMAIFKAGIPLNLLIYSIEYQ